MKGIALFLVFIFLVCGFAFADGVESPRQEEPTNIRCSVGDIRDSRSTGEFFNDLKVEIKLMGDELEGVEKIRVNLTRVTDDTGRDLIKEDKNCFSGKFKDLIKNNAGQGTFEVTLKNPSRKAAVIKDMSGEIELYFPAKDPRASIRIEQFMQNVGKPVHNPNLKVAQVELTVFDKKTYEELAKREAEAKKKEAGAGMVNELTAEMVRAFSAIFGGFSENSVILKVNDPQSKIVGFKFYDASGKQIKSSSWGSSGDTQSFSFDSPMPSEATMVIMLKTERSVQNIPIQFTDIMLP